MKHIEQIQPEVAAGELSRLLVADADATATAALTALLHNVTGCDIPQTDTTPQSDVDELVPLAVSILRRHWKTPLTALGDGNTPMSLADLMRRLILGRVDGNEALGIPPANANISTAVAALRERKIGGVPELPDGLSFAHLLCDSSIADTITELIDDNIGWVMDKTPTLPSTLTKLVLNCKEINISTSVTIGGSLSILEFPSLELITGHIGKIRCSDYANFPQLKVIQTLVRGDYSDFVFAIPKFDMPLLEKLDMGKTARGQSAQNVFGACQMKVLEFPSLRTLMPHSNGTECNLIKDNDYVEEILMDKLTDFYMFRIGYGIGNCHNLRVLSLSSLKHFIINYSSTDNSQFLTGCTSLIKIVIGEDFNSNLRLPAWSPTSVLSDSSRLPEFLSNFKTYIADRLSDNGSGKTLTLSQEVRDAIQQDPEIVSIITSKGWTISPAPSV